MNLEYKDKLIDVTKIFVRDLGIGELRALRYSEKVLSIWIKGVENHMRKEEITEDVRKVVGEFYKKYPESKVTLALSQILDELVFEQQKEMLK